jgi:hypothetical protein
MVQSMARRTGKRRDRYEDPSYNDTLPQSLDLVITVDTAGLMPPPTMTDRSRCHAP